MIPEPTPVVGTWKGPLALSPLAVIVTTDGWAAATIAVMSSPVTVVWLTAVAFALWSGVATGPGRRLAVRIAPVPPAARTADRRLTARRPASPRPPARDGRGSGVTAGASWGGSS